MKPISLILESLKTRVKSSRYEHTLRVMTYGESLAKVHGVCLEQFMYAAALHDYCKALDDWDMLIGLDSHQINEVIKDQPNLAHGFKAAQVAKEKYDIHDEVILKSIEDHTFGSETISDLGKILYLSDHLEPKRYYEGIEDLRQLVLQDLNEAVVLAASNTLTYEINQGHLLHEDTIKMRNCLLMNLKNEKQL